MLKEVSQTTLVRVLKDTPHTLCNVEIGNPFLLVIMSNIVGHTVLQTSYSEAVVGGDVLCQCSCDQQKEYESIKKSSFYHCYLCLFAFRTASSEGAPNGQSPHGMVLPDKENIVIAGVTMAEVEGNIRLHTR